MADQQTSTEVKTIVVPKALEEFFAHRLESRYAERGDVRVIVDRRQAERRVGTGPRPDERETAYVIAWVDGRVDRQHTSYENSRRVERFDPSKQKPAPRLVTREVA